jgi:hypothetical protein
LMPYPMHGVIPNRSRERKHVAWSSSCVYGEVKSWNNTCMVKCMWIFFFSKWGISPASASACGFEAEGLCIDFTLSRWLLSHWLLAVYSISELTIHICYFRLQDRIKDQPHH